MGEGEYVGVGVDEPEVIGIKSVAVTEGGMVVLVGVGLLLELKRNEKREARVGVANN